MPLTNNQQAIVVLISVVLIALGTAQIAIPDGIPEEQKAYIALFLTLAGAVGLALKEAAGIPQPTQTTSPPGSSTKTQFFSSFISNQRGMAGIIGQEHDPRPRRHKGHRKGVEPKGLKRWRLSQRRTYDPGTRRSLWRGPRGGHFFQGPRKRRYDPAPRRFGGFHGRLGGYATKVEQKLTQYGTYLGFFGAMLYGMKTGNDHVHKWFGPNASYWQFVGGQAQTMISDPAGKYAWILQNSLFSDNSAWKYPFWASLGAWIGTHFMPDAGTWGRIKRPLSKISFGALIASAIGILFLPASDPSTMRTTLATQPTNAAPAVITPQSNQAYYG